MFNLLQANKLILKEGAVVERLRRSPGIELHPTLVNAPLIYDDNGRSELKKIYNSYINIAKSAELPILICTPTWRANDVRVSHSEIDENINVDAVNFMKALRDEHPEFSSKIKIGGIIGCKGDCYKPEEGLSAKESELFHAWQINELIKGGVDFIIAETMPNVEEALGMAKYLSKTEIEYIISFCISREGLILDGNSLSNAITRIDEAVQRPPLAYAINCAYPTFLCAENQPKEIFERLISFSGNGSSLDHCDLDNAVNLQKDDVGNWGEEMLKLNRSYGIKILGGCCGTDVEHLNYLVNH